MKRKKVTLIGFSWTQSLWSTGTAFIRFAAEGKVTHVYTVSLATVNASHNAGLRNIENLTISQLAVWYSSGEVKGLVS